MTNYEIKKMIRAVIREELSTMLMGTIQENASASRSSFKRFENESSIPNARSIQPFGFSSKAPAKTKCLVAPINGDATHQNIIGHFDEKKPDIEDGESAMYSEGGKQIKVSNDKIQIGSNQDETENLVLGQIFKKFASDLIIEMGKETHICLPPGYDSLPPTNKPAYDALKASPIDDELILSDIAFTGKD